MVSSLPSVLLWVSVLLFSGIHINITGSSAPTYTTTIWSTANGTTGSPTNGTTESPANVTTGSTANGTMGSTTNGTTRSPTNGTTGSPTNGTTESPANVTTGSTANGTMLGSTTNGTTGSPTNGTTGSPTNGTTGSPTNGTTESPANVTTGSTANGTMGSTTNGTTGSPTNGTTGSPTNGTTGSPTNGTTESPANVTTGSTANGTMLGSTTNGTTGSPTNGTTGSPTNGTTESPANVTTGSTANGTMGSTTNGTTGSPTNGTTGSPINGTTGSPTNGTTESPANVTTGSTANGTMGSTTNGTTESTANGITGSISNGSTILDSTVVKTPVESVTSPVTQMSRWPTEEPDFGELNGVLINITLNLVLNSDFSQIEDHDLRQEYSDNVTADLTTFYNGTNGFRQVKVFNLTRGSVKVHYKVSYDAPPLLKNLAAAKIDFENITHKIQESSVNGHQVKSIDDGDVFDDAIKTFKGQCRERLKTCPRGFLCDVQAGGLICSSVCSFPKNSCGKHGSCELTPDLKPICRCEAEGRTVYSGEKCQIARSIPRDHGGTKDTSKWRVIGIACAAAGGVALLLLIIAGWLLYRRRGQKKVVGAHSEESLWLSPKQGDFADNHRRTSYHEDNAAGVSGMEVRRPSSLRLQRIASMDFSRMSVLPRPNLTSTFNGRGDSELRHLHHIYDMRLPNKRSSHIYQAYYQRD